MIPLDVPAPAVPIPAQAQQIRAVMRQVERRQWGMWSTAVLVTLLLTLGIASFAFPGLISEAEASFNLSLAMRGLVGLVLIFNVYTIYQQLQIHRIQRDLGDQVEALGKMEVRTEEVYKLAVLDPLTGLNNRRSGEHRLAEEIARAQRHGRPLTVLLLDLNGLKQLNDKYGHAAGDEMIRQFATRLNKAVRGSDLAVRIGGDEFMVLLPECKLEEVRHVLSRLSGLNVDCGRESVALSFSAGWTNYLPGESAEEFLKRADEALYANKRARQEQEKIPVAVR
jgi:diguanylate cyclase (GGDEF)-like protein